MNIFQDKPFIYIHPDTPSEGCGNILQVESPHLIGKVSKFKDGDQFYLFKTMHPISAQVEGYRILLVYCGSFNTKIELDIHTIKNVLSKMATYYLENRIKQKLYSFKNYKT